MELQLVDKDFDADLAACMYAPEKKKPRKYGSGKQTIEPWKTDLLENPDRKPEEQWIIDNLHDDKYETWLRYLRADHQLFLLEFCGMSSSKTELMAILSSLETIHAMFDHKSFSRAYYRGYMETRQFLTDIEAADEAGLKGVFNSIRKLLDEKHGSSILTEENSISTEFYGQLTGIKSVPAQFMDCVYGRDLYRGAGLAYVR